MNVFVLEDQEERIEWFLKRFPEDSFILFAHSAMEGTDLLSQYWHIKEWDYVFLDYDLGYKGRQLHWYDGTGAEVARYIVQTRPRIKHIIIHSWNPEGAKYMFDGLLSAGYVVSRVPFNPEL